MAAMLLAGTGAAIAAPIAAPTSAARCHHLIEMDASSSSSAAAAKVTSALCVVFAGAAARYETDLIPEPLRVRLVDEIAGSRLNTQFVLPGFLNARAGHLEITGDLVDTFSDDELAMVLAHEATHLIHSDGTALRVLKSVCQAVWLLAGFAVAAAIVHRRRPSLARSAAAVAIGFATMMAMLLATTVLVAGVNTRYEFRADAGAIELLEAAGWGPERAHAGFTGFLMKNGGRAAGSWLSQDRHPSDADRARALGSIGLAT